MKKDHGQTVRSIATLAFRLRCCDVSVSSIKVKSNQYKRKVADVILKLKVKSQGKNTLDKPWQRSKASSKELRSICLVW